ncbi:LuxR C-terminal-related transcriptional regulator [Rhodococcus sp. ACS1]|uniref:helix-turn-helix transcriptional regulator n=1 Tax=Rhodococcus sp. ACS1 TaxID=2028570 RepID=UPI0015C759B3|nr:LuxR C-terminal-related transcriptional regulator [Rhodococcus sp. ACS1]
MTGKSHVPTADTSLLDAMDALRTRSGMEMVFVANVLPSCDAVQVTSTHGARTGTMSDLVVHRGAGLGGKALLLNRPVAVSSYKTAGGITHDYDAQVLGEGLETLAAFPPVLSGSPDVLIYLGNRRQINLGERWYEQLRPWVQQLVHAVSAMDRPPDRSTSLASALRESEIAFLLRELDEIAAELDSEALRARLAQVRARLGGPRAARGPENAPNLTRREIDVLREAARGLTNRAVGANLNLVENSVKTYLRTAMRKLNVTNRVQAIIAARAFGLID